MAKSNSSAATANDNQTTSTYGLGTLFELSQTTALATFQAAVQTQRAADQMAQNFIEAGAAAQKEYLNSLYKIRQEWLKQSAETTEKLLTLSPVAFEFPFRREIEDLSAQVVDVAKQVIEPFIAPLKASAK